MDSQSTKRKPKAPLIIGIIALAVACFDGVYWYVSNLPANPYKVSLVVNAAGLDTETDTKIPIRVSGTDKDGNEIDAVYYESASSSDIELKPGEYEVSVEASPISQEGVIYDVDDAATKVVMDEKGKATVENEITLDPIPAAEVTQEEIDAACKAAQDSGIEQDRLSQLKDKATQRMEQGEKEKAAALYKEQLQHVDDLKIDPRAADIFSRIPDPKITYQYALVHMDKDPVPQMLIMIDSMASNRMSSFSCITVVAYDKKTGKLVHPTEIMQVGVALVGGFRGGVSASKDANGLLHWTVSSGTGEFETYRWTLAVDKDGTAHLEPKLVERGNMAKGGESATLRSEEIKIEWHDIDDLGPIDNM